MMYRRVYTWTGGENGKEERYTAENRGIGYTNIRISVYEVVSS